MHSLRSAVVPAGKSRSNIDNWLTNSWCVIFFVSRSNWRWQAFRRIDPEQFQRLGESRYPKPEIHWPLLAFAARSERVMGDQQITGKVDGLDELGVALGLSDEVSGFHGRSDGEPTVQHIACRTVGLGAGCRS
jgi:hypothetical protein